MKAKESNSMGEQAEEGVHFARIVGLTNLGEQPAWEWQGETQPPAFKLELTYELVNTGMSDGRPFFVSEEITNSKSDAASLHVRATAANASLDDLETLLDTAVSVTVKHNAKGYAKINGKGGVAGVPHGITVPALKNDTFFFDFEAENCDVDRFLKMPEFKQNKIRAASEFVESPLARKLAEQDRF